MNPTTTILAPYSNPLFRFISDKKYRWLRHCLFILLGLILAFKGDIGDAQHYPSEEARNTILKVDVVTFVFITSMLYLLMMVLIPRFLFRGKFFIFFTGAFVIIFLIYVVVWLLDVYLIRPVNIPNLYHIEWSLLNFIQIGAVSSVLLGSVTGMMVFKKWINDIQRMSELHQSSLRAELAQLKSQVNPHFLFNTLNNLLVLIKTDVEKASQVLLGLSDLLRYQLYDSSKDKILLSKDIEFIKNLLALEKIRKNDFFYEIKTVGHTEGLQLPPFLFIPFVENAIKHGASTVGQSYLTLEFSVQGNALHFISENSKPPVRTKMAGGLGLANIRRRLELLYPGTYQLEIKETDLEYTVNLIIPI